MYIFSFLTSSGLHHLTPEFCNFPTDVEFGHCGLIPHGLDVPRLGVVQQGVSVNPQQAARVCHAVPPCRAYVWLFVYHDLK